MADVARFEVGKTYRGDDGMTYTITRRTEKSVWYKVLNSEQRRKVFTEMYPHCEVFYIPTSINEFYHIVYAN